MYQEAANLEKEEEEHKKIMKQEALQLLKKKEKADNIIKVFLKIHLPVYRTIFRRKNNCIQAMLILTTDF